MNGYPFIDCGFHPPPAKLVEYVHLEIWMDVIIEVYNFKSLSLRFLAPIHSDEYTQMQLTEIIKINHFRLKMCKYLTSPQFS